MLLLLFDHRKRLRTRWEACQFVNGHPKVQHLAVRVKGGAMEPQVVVRLFFIVAGPTRSFFRSVEASQMIMLLLFFTLSA